MKATKAFKILVSAFKAGTRAALVHDPMFDGGTCNFDTVAIRLPHVRAFVVKAAALSAGVYVSKYSERGSGWWHVDCGWKGQGARRTAMAHAACEAIERAVIGASVLDWQVRVYYRMD